MPIWRFVRTAFVATFLVVALCLSSSCTTYKRSILIEPLVLLNLSNGPTWRYSVLIHKEYPMDFKAGDTIGIAGEGIKSASVEGEAREEKFGGWRLKEVDWNYVTFEATCDATVGGAFGYFSVSAPRAKEGKVRWLWTGQAHCGCWDETLGPASEQ